MNYVDSFTQSQVFNSLLKKFGNSRCADCNNQQPRWASTTFGTIVCIRCSGFHRKLGTHVTKVRSINLDRWTPELLDIYKRMSIFIIIRIIVKANEIANKYWEKMLPPGYQRPSESSSDEYIWKFIQDKYLKKAFVHPDSVDPTKISMTKNEPKIDEVKNDNIRIENSIKSHTLLQQQTKAKPIDFEKLNMIKGDKGDDRLYSESESENSPVKNLSPDIPTEIAEEKSKKPHQSRIREELTFAPRAFAVGVNAFTYLNSKFSHMHRKSAMTIPVGISNKQVTKSIKIQLGAFR